MGVFHDVLFPPAISYGAEGGPEFQTRIITTGSGHEYRNVEWDLPRGRWNVAYGVKSRDEAMELRTFFYQRRGKAYPFRFKDWMDFRAEDEALGVGNGSQLSWKLYKWYGTDGTPFGRRIILPVNPTDYPDNGAGATTDPFVITGDGVVLDPSTYTVDWLKGIVLFNAAPLAGVTLLWSGEFHCPCRFDTDYFNPTLVEYDTIDWPDVSVLELRPEEFLSADEV